MTSPLLLVLSGLAAAPAVSATEVAWRSVATGVDYAAITLQPKPSIGDGVLHVVRVDPSKAGVRSLAISQAGGRTRTARQWREEHKLVAVINAGMYETDFSTHTGFFRIGEHVNSSRWVKSYQSVLVLGPRKAGLPAADVRDAVSGAGSGAHDDYGTVIQNLRLIRGPGVNVWKENKKRWSEAAIALDRDGKLLLLFCRSPFSMHELNEVLLASPLGIVRAMHVEGGPEASLSLKGGGIELDLSGSYETGFVENDDNKEQWPLPNVIGITAGP